MKKRANHRPLPVLAQDPRLSRGKVVFSGNERHLAILIESLRRRSPRFWNRWRAEHPKLVPDLRRVVLSGRALREFDLRRVRFDGALLRRVDFRGSHLGRASLKGADLELANLRGVHAEQANFGGASLGGANLREACFHQAICRDETSFQYATLREADFTGAKLEQADLSAADLSQTCFDNAHLTGAALNDAILDGTSLRGTRLRGAYLYGALIRRAVTDENTDQRSLGVDVHVVWERPKGQIIEFTDTDDIHVAQFHDIFDEHGSVAKLLSATTRRVVLILGRFLPRRKRVLDRLAQALRVRGKIPVIFDFPGPEDREVIDTVRFIAGMSQFVVVDMTKASSVPLELQATIPDMMIPVLPIVEADENIFSMFTDLQRRYFWIQPPVSYKNVDELVRHVDGAIINRAKQAAEEIQKRREESVRSPVRVTRFS